MYVSLYQTATTFFQSKINHHPNYALFIHLPYFSTSITNQSLPGGTIYYNRIVMSSTWYVVLKRDVLSTGYYFNMKMNCKKDWKMSLLSIRSLLINFVLRVWLIMAKMITPIYYCSLTFAYPLGWNTSTIQHFESSSNSSKQVTSYSYPCSHAAT